MARKLRVEYAGAIYHVMSRGDRRELIFHDQADRQRFVQTLGQACAKTDWQVLAERLSVGSRGYLNHLLDRWRQAHGQ